MQLFAVKHTAKQQNVARYTLPTGSPEQALKCRVADPWGKTALISTSLPAYPDRITCVLVFLKKVQQAPQLQCVSYSF